MSPLCCSAPGCKGSRRGRRRLGPAVSQLRAGSGGSPSCRCPFPSAVRTVTLWGKKKTNTKKLQTRGSRLPGFDSLVNVRHWKDPDRRHLFFHGDRLPFEPGAAAESGLAHPLRAAGRCGRQRGEQERRPGSFPHSGNVRREIAPAPTAH